MHNGRSRSVVVLTNHRTAGRHFPPKFPVPVPLPLPPSRPRTWIDLAQIPSRSARVFRYKETRIWHGTSARIGDRILDMDRSHRLDVARRPVAGPPLGGTSTRMRLEPAMSVDSQV